MLRHCPKRGAGLVLEAMADLQGVLRETARRETDEGAAGRPGQSATLPATVDATLRGEEGLDEVADAMFGDAHFDEYSDEETAASPARRDGSRTPPRARATTGKGAGGSSRGR